MPRTKILDSKSDPVKKWQIMFHHAISTANIILVKQALGNGAKMNNNQSKKNTLNCALRAMLSANVTQYDFNFIIQLMDLGALMSLSDGNNILSIIIEHGGPYINRYRESAKENVLELIESMIKLGAEPNNNANSSNNTLYIATICADIDVMNIIVKYCPSLRPNYLTLIQAVKTKKMEIINMVCELGTRSITGGYVNTLIEAIKTRDCKIVRKIIMHGEKPPISDHIDDNDHNINYYGIQFLRYNHSDNLILCYYRNFLEQYDSSYSRGPYNTFSDKFSFSDKLSEINNTVDQMLNLIICSGASILRSTVKLLQEKEQKSYIDSRILILYDLLNGVISPETEKTRKELILMMDELTENGNLKRMKIKIMADTVMCLPLVCVDIIYEYQKSGCVKFIDFNLF